MLDHKRLLALAPLLLLTLPAPPARGQTPRPGDVLVRSLLDRRICLYRPDGDRYNCVDKPTDQTWEGGAFTPDLGWVTLGSSINGWRLRRYDAEGKKVLKVLVPSLWGPTGVAVTPGGALIVADLFGQGVHVLDLTGVPVTFIHTPAFTPRFLDATDDEEFWVTSSAGEVQRFDLAGNLLANLWLPFTPGGVSVAADGSLWFYEEGGNLVAHVTETGVPLSSFQVPGTVFGVAAGQDGSVWVVTNLDEALELDQAGNVLTSFPIIPTATGIEIATPGGPMGVTYCSPATPNSTGLAATIRASGRPYVLLNELELRASDLPPGRLGAFIGSPTQGQSLPPGSQGTLCLGGTVVHLPPASTGTAGTLERKFPIKVLALPGETWSFQAWYRDRNSGPTSNLTDGVAVTLH